MKKEKYYYKDASAEKEITNMEKMMKSEKIEDSYIRELVGKQKGALSVSSKYYKGNIAEGNWSLIEKDLDIENLDKKTIDAESVYTKSVDALDVIKGLDEYPKRKKYVGKLRKNNAEYEYVFIPSYYSVKTLILYYIKDKKHAERIYGLKNSIVRQKGKKFYGGLPFILRYMGGNFEDERVDFEEFVETLIDFASGVENNNENNFLDDFINDIIDCLNDFYGKNLILERRIKNFNESKENWFNIDFYKETEGEKDFLLNYMPVNDYKILMHRDVKKDFQSLQKKQAIKAREKISKTPKYPNNDSLKDSEILKGDLKGWLSQRISKKDRLVYKIEKDKKIAYIATACDHYKDAPRRLKSIDTYIDSKEVLKDS